MNPYQRKLFKSIDHILWKDWDPLQLYPAAPKDEYQNYTSELFHLKISAASISLLEDKLLELENKILGREGNPERCKKIASIIFNL